MADTPYCDNCKSTDIGPYKGNKTQCNACYHQWRCKPSAIPPQQLLPPLPDSDYDDDDTADFERRIFDWMECIPTKTLDELNTDTTTFGKQQNKVIPPDSPRKKSTTSPRNPQRTELIKPLKRIRKEPASLTVPESPSATSTLIKESTSSVEPTSPIEPTRPKGSLPSTDVATSSLPITPPPLRNLFIPKRRRPLSQQHQQYTSSDSLKRPLSSAYPGSLFSTISNNKHHDTITRGIESNNRPHEKITLNNSTMPMVSSLNYSYSQQATSQQNPSFNSILPFSPYVPRDKSPIYSNHRTPTRHI